MRKFQRRPPLPLLHVTFRSRGVWAVASRHLLAVMYQGGAVWHNASPTVSPCFSQNLLAGGRVVSGQGVRKWKELQSPGRHP